MPISSKFMKHIENERIKEEMRAGKGIKKAVSEGYRNAYSAIIDANATTFFTGVILYIFGTGPIKGFAVTLFWGVIISLYTAYVITKQIFDIRKGYRTLSI